MASTPNLLNAPNNGFVRITAANTNSQGAGTIGTDIFLLDSTSVNNTFIRAIHFVPTATAPTTTTATVARVFISTQSSGATTNANTYPIGEIQLPAVAADNATNPAPVYVLPVNRSFAGSLHVLVTNHAAPAANTAWVANIDAADY